MAAMWGVWLTWLVAALFLVNGVVNLFNPPAFRESLARLGFPSWFYLFNGAFQIATGALMAFETTRRVGFVLAVLVCFVVYAALIRSREFGHLGPITVLSALVGLAIWKLYA
jgi:DoxX-like family